MRKSQGKNFLLSDEVLNHLEQSISLDRLRPYLILASGDRRHAIALYEWNTSLSESLYGLLQGLEVALRNTMHNTIASAFRRQDWYDGAFVLDSFEQETIDKAKNRVFRDAKPITASNIIPELNFGFWVALTRPFYAQSLWDKHLHRCFRIHLKRQRVHAQLESIKKLRNRVAHHESILSRNLMDDYSRIMTILNWICPTSAAWIKSNLTLLEKIKQRPEKTCHSPF
jgi:hypothetical protein